MMSGKFKLDPAYAALTSSDVSLSFEDSIIKKQSEPVLVDADGKAIKLHHPAKKTGRRIILRDEKSLEVDNTPCHPVGEVRPFDILRDKLNAKTLKYTKNKEHLKKNNFIKF